MENQEKKSNLIVGIAIAIMAVTIIGLVWLICFVAKIGMYEPEVIAPYTFINEKSVNYYIVEGEKEGNEYVGDTYVYISEKISGNKLEKVYYSFDANGETKKEITASKFTGEKEITLMSDVTTIQVKAEDLNNLAKGKEFKIWILSFDSDSNMEEICTITVAKKSK